MADRDYWGEALYREGKGPYPYTDGAERTHAALKRADRLRPLGPYGKRGNLHTDSCGCEDK